MKFTQKVLPLPLMLLFCMQSFAQSSPEFYLRGLLNIFRKDEGTLQQRTAVLNTIIPADISNNVIYSLSVHSAWYYTAVPSNYTSFKNDNYLELCKRFDSTGYSWVASIGEKGSYPDYPNPPASLTPGVTGYFITPAQVDSIFKYTQHCTGIESGENFWTYNATNVNSVLDLLRVCKKYNKKYILGEGGWGYNSFMRFFADNYSVLKNEGLGQYLVPTFKNTKPYGALVTLGSLLGGWITGLVSDYGTWNDQWTWTYGSFGQAGQFPSYTKSDNNYTKIPYTHYLKSWLLTIAMGGKANFMENDGFSRAGTVDANFEPYLRPFIKGLADHSILPSKDSVLAKTKAIANPYPGTYNLSNGTTAPYTGANLVSYRYNIINFKPVASGTYAEPFARLFTMTSGFWNDTAYTNTGTATDRYYTAVKNATGQNLLVNALVREVLPNNPRYLIVPIIPHDSAVSQVPSQVQVLNLSSYQTNAGIQTAFQSLYPAVAGSVTAWQLEANNSFFVLNSHENADIDQQFSFYLGVSGIKSVSGTIPFQNILFGKREGANEYWFQSNGYEANDGITAGQKFTCTEKPTTLYFKCDEMPTLAVEDAKSNDVTQTWNDTTKTLKVLISHPTGAVNFSIALNNPAARARQDSYKLSEGAETPGTISVYPNPVEAGKQLHVRIFSKTAADRKVILSSITRKVIFQENFRNVPSGISTFNIDIPSVPAGSYFLTIQQGQETTTSKIVITR